jgi:hypothetical protein
MATYQARVLVIANQTAGSPELVAALQARQQKGPVVPTLLMPAVRNGFAGKEETRERLDDVIAQWREAGLPAEGVVGDPDPAVAVQETWDPRNFDEVIVSTLPERISHWLKRDLPTRIERLGMPVTVVRARQAREPLHPPIRYIGP